MHGPLVLATALICPGYRYTAEISKPVVSVCAVRTGSRKPDDRRVS
jgi:hypothetical protein